MLAAARRGDVHVIVVEDASRLWRNMAEQSPRLAELRDLGVQVVTHDLDTRQESAEWMGAILGTAAAAYRGEIARRTRRELEGRALKRMPTGGRSYGYVSAAEGGTGTRRAATGGRDRARAFARRAHRTGAGRGEVGRRN